MGTESLDNNNISPVTWSKMMNSDMRPQSRMERLETYISRVPEMPCALCGVWYMGLWGTLGILWLRRRFTKIRGLA